MKFCTSCGNEMFDDAVICTKCGRMAAMPQFQQPVPQAPQPTPVNQAPVQGQGMPVTKGKAINLVMTILSFVSSVLNSIALFFLVGAIFNPRIHFYYESTNHSIPDSYPTYSSYSTRYYKFTEKYVRDASIYFAEEFAITALIFFLASSLICLTNVILSIYSKERLEKLLPKIAKFVFAFLLMIAFVAF